MTSLPDYLLLNEFEVRTVSLDQVFSSSIYSPRREKNEDP